MFYITGTYFFSRWLEFTVGDILWYVLKIWGRVAKFKSENFVPAINLSVWKETGVLNHPSVSTYDKWNFKPQISSIFHFDLASDGRMAHVLSVKTNTLSKVCKLKILGSLVRDELTTLVTYLVFPCFLISQTVSDELILIYTISWRK